MILTRIAAVDDAPESRESFGEWIENLFDAEPVLIEEVPVNAAALIDRVRRENIDGVVVDYMLNTRGYSTADGIDLVTALTAARIPAVLATSYGLTNIGKFVWHGRDVPAVVLKGKLEESLRDAFAIALQRARGYYTPATEPYPSLVRVTALDDTEAGLMVPAFGADALLVNRAELARRLHPIELSVGLRFEADVNIGAEQLERLYVSEPRALPNLDDRYAKLLHS